MSHSLVFEWTPTIESYFPLPLDVRTHPEVLPVGMYPDTELYPYQTFMSLAAYSRAYWNFNLPPYYWPARLTFEHVWVALAGNLVSPARGLFVYVPAALVALVALISSPHQVQQKVAASVAVVVITAHLVGTSGLGHWWGGHSYGPRLMTGVLPWLVLIVMQVSALPRWRTALAVAALAGVLLNAPGAFSVQAMRWNLDADVDTHPDRVWSWRDPQFLAWYTR